MGKKRRSETPEQRKARLKAEAAQRKAEEKERRQEEKEEVTSGLAKSSQ